jgi:hypothetical protein
LGSAVLFWDLLCFFDNYMIWCQILAIKYGSFNQALAQQLNKFQLMKKYIFVSTLKPTIIYLRYT